MAEVVQGLRRVEGIKGVDPVGETGVLGVAGKDLEGEVRVDGPQLCEDGQEDGVVPGVAPAVSAADRHLGTPLAGVPEDGLIDIQLVVHHGLHGEKLLCLGVKTLAHGLAQGGVLG